MVPAVHRAPASGPRACRLHRRGSRARCLRPPDRV